MDPQPVTVENLATVTDAINALGTKLDSLYEFQVYLAHGVWLAAGLILGFAILWVQKR